MDPDTGRRDGVFFKPIAGAHELSLPCGRCIGCRVASAEAWATRVMHEAQFHEHSCFLTLTYNDDHLPHDSGLNYRDFQLFMKRVRKWQPDRRYCGVAATYRGRPYSKLVLENPIRYYMCGEYGDQKLRPHYHCALFGAVFPDMVPLYRTQSGSLIYESATLTKLWDLGHASIGELTSDSAAYIARYVVKKISGEAAAKHYRRVDPDTGEVFQVSPEFTRMSLKPGIGQKWIKKYYADVYPTDRINTQGKLTKPPRYYDKQMEVTNPDILTPVAEQRYKRAILTSEDNTAARLDVKHKLALAKAKFLKRNLE